MNDTKSVVLECFRRLGTWDADAVGELFADEVDWNVPAIGSLRWTGRRSRRVEIPAYFKTMWSHFLTEHSRVVSDILLVDGDDAVQLGTFHHVTRMRCVAGLAAADLVSSGFAPLALMRTSA